jgi:hypothetical protein
MLWLNVPMAIDFKCGGSSTPLSVTLGLRLTCATVLEEKSPAWGTTVYFLALPTNKLALAGI